LSHLPLNHIFCSRKVILLFSLAVAVARAQVQQESRLETTENTGINISCSHPKIQTSEYIYWYRHLPGRGPEFLAHIVKESKELPDIAGGLWVSADRRSKEGGKHLRCVSSSLVNIFPTASSEEM
uniref:Uncharacterized protein n=1 Tax=Corvus moneduloides TaxID=1196302 RepID=A0A8U7NJ36_CORMO